MSDLTEIIKDSFTQYSGAVLQSRALIDVRDCIKPSARQIFYCLYNDKLTYDKPRKKTLNAIGSLTKVYIHGDGSALGVLMRAAQSFAMRYPIMDVRGNAGTLIESGDWAAPRYSEVRLGQLGCQFFDDVNKNTIDDWRDNYDDTFKYPAVLPSKGFYNIVNGSYGIGIGMSCSIPQFNLQEVNEALIHLMYHPDCEFDDIYCAPDFATGGILVNEAEVKESLKKGTGKACKLRAKIEWDEKDRALCVVEMPYAVYTSIVCKELEAILEREDNPGIDRFNDLTGVTANIKIYLTKRANPSAVIKYLYKNTSLQAHYSVNMVMLEDGRFPRIFTWKQALTAYLKHQCLVYHRAFLYDLDKALTRLHIVEGLLIAIANINEVIEVIKGSASTAAALVALQNKFNLSELQAKAILEIKLSRLAHLEVTKLQDEKLDLTAKIEYCRKVLSDDMAMKQVIEKDLRTTAKQYGDARRTQILDIETDAGDIVEEKNIIISVTNYGNVLVSESSSLYTSRRGAAGVKVKLKDNECIMQSLSSSTTGSTLFISDKGRGYCIPNSAFVAQDKQHISTIVPLQENETITFCADFKENKKYIVFVTKQGMLKKTLLSDLRSIKRGTTVIKLQNGDSIVSIFLMNDENIGALNSSGKFIIFDSTEVNAVGRVAMGVKVMNLGARETIVNARPIPADTEYIAVVTASGEVAKFNRNEFSVSGRVTKGVATLAAEKNSYVGFAPISPSHSTITFVTSKSMVKTELSNFTAHKRGTKGIKGLKVPTDSAVQAFLLQ